MFLFACRVPGAGPGDVDGGALGVIAVDGGTLRMYYNEAKDNLYIVASCDCGHKNCKRERTLMGRKTMSGKKAQGRPIGYLCAWLRGGRGPGINTKALHQGIAVSREARIDARDAFKALDGAEEWLDRERPKDADEPEEPYGNP